LFLTGSIRRKMVVGLAVVLVMLGILSLSGISGLVSYRNVVNDLDFSINKAPRHADLVAAVGALFEPLVLEVRGNPAPPRIQQQEFQKQLEIAEQRVLDFRWKLDALPRRPQDIMGHRVAERLLLEIDLGLHKLKFLQDALGDNVRHAAARQEMLTTIAQMQSVALRVPDLQAGVQSTLRQAPAVYRSRLWLVVSATVVVLILFLGLVRCGYVWIFDPIRKLYQGASRVARGDFNYRVELNTNDEMAELAESFNAMTARFQEIACDLDRQVRERSNQLVRSERLAGVGFLAAGVAHEINNPLSAISMAAESLDGRIDELLAHADESEAAVVRQYLQMMQREADRCRQITTRLLDFSRGQDATRSRNDLAAIVYEVLAVVEHLSKFRDRKIIFQQDTPCFLEINGPEIKQVVLNLVANALESMQRGGTLEVKIQEQTDHVDILFIDDGCGMTSHVIENLFEPFFTQKQDGKGTGLGLSISHRIISDHGGTIEAHSDGPGCGTTFRVQLPRRAAQKEAA
jgi:two-component system, NtrC family, sensor kinase